MPSIKAELGASSLRQAAEKIRRYAAGFDNSEQQFVRKAVGLGTDTASEAYGQSVSVRGEAEGTSGKVIASGDAVTFLEFGAGYQAFNGDFPSANIPFDVRPGSWSETEGSGEFARTYAQGDGRWHFGGRVYKFVAPRRGMGLAEDAIIQQTDAIVKEVFKK